MPHPITRQSPSTYFVQNQSNEELKRLQIQDQMLTQGMGGVLPEQPDFPPRDGILDVGCGAGGWLIEMAKAYPQISMLYGVDISQRMIAYARAQAEAQQVSDRVTFVVMDALRKLDFADQQFALINHRLGSSFLRVWEWLPLLGEYQRICRPGGIIRLTEGNFCVQSNSPALTHLFDLAVTAFYRAGHLFLPDGQSILHELAPLMQRFTIQPVQTCAYMLEYRAGTLEWHAFVDDITYGFQTIIPFLQKWAPFPENYEETYQRALHEMSQKGFVAQIELLTVWSRIDVWQRSLKPDAFSTLDDANQLVS